MPKSFVTKRYGRRRGFRGSGFLKKD